MKFKCLLALCLVLLFAGCSQQGDTPVPAPVRETPQEVVMWWANGWNADKNNLYVESDEYFLSMFISKHDTKISGLFAADNMSSRAYIVNDGEEKPVSRYCGVSNGDINGEQLSQNVAQIVDSGNIMNQVEIPLIFFDAAPGVNGSMNIAAARHHAAFTLSLNTGDVICYELTLPEGTVDKGGFYEYAGKTFNIYSQAETVKNGSTVTFKASGSVTFYISTGESFVDPDVLALTYGGKTADFDIKRGVLTVTLPEMHLDYTIPEDHLRYNQNPFTIENPTDKDVTVPIAFDDYTGRSANYIPGGVPMLRDAVTGEPTGIPVQISKNWHMGQWYHFYSAITVPANSSVSYNFTLVASKWGGVYAVSHAQLCLIGWNSSEGVGNQVWDQSALGDWGEAITYDPDKNLGRANVNDVRPFLVQASEKWFWTGNVGGADFLVYHDRDNKRKDTVGNKTRYLSQGPCMSDVVYTGVSSDGAISMEATVNMGRTDDVVRAYYTLNYTFLADTTYSRLALFQLCADRYSDNNYTKFAYGAAEVWKDGAADTGTHGYQSDSDKYIKGEPGMWYFLYDSAHRKFGGTPVERENANLLAVVREYTGKINGKQVNMPYFNIYNVGQGSRIQPAFELTVPPTKDNKISAGSKISVTIEFVVLPSDKEDYYGESGYLNALDFDFSSTDMALYQAKNATQQIRVATGGLVGEYPAVIESADNRAEFTITGGLGYVPVSITGLDGYSNTIEYFDETDSLWKPVKQSEDNDFWQCRKIGDGYTLTYNLLPGTYRVN